MDTDSVLIKQAKAGNEMAAESVLRKYQERILGYLYLMLHDFQDAQDATQNTFVAVLNGFDRYEDRGQFKSWLFRIAQRQGMRILRKRKRLLYLRPDLSSRESMDEFPDTEAQLPAEKMVDQETSKQLFNAVSSLPDLERQVLLLRIKGEMSFKEIADVLDCPLNTALGRMHNATQKLKTIFRGAGA